ncbi:MAG: thioredoxin family protein [Burkholderiaceae bacterium]
MNLPRLLVLLTVVAAVGACSKKAETPPMPKTTAVPIAPAVAADARHSDDAIAWRRGDVDAAFAEAKATNKPVFLYWGAGWCPPCNQMKAMLFNRREFVERMQYFVPVYVDGDTPAAQKLGTRYSVSGYPTMVLFAPDGIEITRLPGEADPERYLQVLTLGMSSVRPVRATLKTALSDGKGLGLDDWRMLAWYSWDTDDQQLVPTGQVRATLQKLADRCPAAFTEPRTRLILKTAAATGDASERKPRARFDAAAARPQIEAVLASPKTARENFDLMTSAMPEMVRAVTAARTPERERIVANADRALALLASDASLSNTDRLGATTARVQLATIDAPASEDGKASPVILPDTLRDGVIAEVARADRESRDPFERQTVVNSAAYLLTTAGMLDRSDALLEAELSRSHSPYYFMLDLAANAKKRGDKRAAIDWYTKAYDGAKGPATRLQWGSTYVRALIELSPDDVERIAKVAEQVIGEVAPAPESFDGRNRKSLSRMADQVALWNARGAHAAESGRIAGASRRLCEQVPAQTSEHALCGQLLKVRDASSKSKPSTAAIGGSRQAGVI